MAFKLNGTSPDVTKQYLYPLFIAGPVRWFEYVTTDAAATVDGRGYIDNTTADGEIAINMLKVGDMVWVTQVASLTDTSPISTDKAGASAMSLHMVTENTGSTLNLSNNLLTAIDLTSGD